jgi:hypothetical protein
MSEPLHLQHYYTNKPGSDFGNSGVTAELKWCHDVMVEAICTPPLIASHIHIGCINIVMAPFNDVRGHMSALLLRYTSKARSDFWQFWVTVEWKWCHGSWPSCHGWGCKPHLVAFWYILVRHIYSVMSPFNDVSVHIMSAPLHCYTNKPGSEFGNSGVTVKLKWCHNVMVEAEDHLWLLLTSILDIYIVLWHLLMMSVCILWMHPYSVTPPRRGQILAILGSLPSGNDAMTHGWGCKPHLIASHIHIGNI